MAKLGEGGPGAAPDGRRRRVCRGRVPGKRHHERRGAPAAASMASASACLAMSSRNIAYKTALEGERALRLSPLASAEQWRRLMGEIEGLEGRAGD